jgi:uncharacterized membrane protein
VSRRIPIIGHSAAHFSDRLMESPASASKKSKANSGMRTNPLRLLKAQPRFFTATLIGALLWFLLPSDLARSTRLLVAWDSATGLYLVLAVVMMARSNIERIHDRAALEDEGQMVILGLTIITAVISLGGIGAEMAVAKTLKGHDEWQHIALAGLTVLLSWTFTHTMFAIHYAHEYYAGPKNELAEGLEFPGDEPADYWDFVYYSFIIGTACATADVNVTSKNMRKITTLHCVVAFFFNTTILALTVNIGAGFF